MAIGNRTFHARKRENIFVGRDAAQNLFRAQCQKLLTAGGVHLVNFYGIGGIGKTALLNRIIHELDDAKKVSAQYRKIFVLYHDFANGTDMRDILQAWKGALENFGCEFPYFELGNFYLFLKEGNTDIDKPKMKSQFEKNTWLNRVKNSLSLTANLSDAVVPGAIAATTIAEVTVDALSIIPGVKTVNEPAKLFNAHLAKNKTEEQLKKNKPLQDELERRAELRNPDKLKTYLPTLFAQDIFDWAGGDKKIIVFLDSCEVLTGEKKLGANNLRCDWWLCGDKDADGLISMMRDTLWIFASRNKISWADKKIISYHLNSLTDSEARTFLEKSKIETSLHEKILEAAKGYPIFLERFVKRKAELEKVPFEDIAPKIREELIERTLRDLNATERTMVQNLCALGKWTDEVVRAEKFNPHTYRKLKELSFIQSADEKFFTLNTTLQKILS